jgi:toxin ParE1/3/4
VRVVWTRAALRGLWRPYDYIVDFNPQAAARMAEALFEAGESLAGFPHRGRPVRGTTMRELVSVQPCVIRYRIAGDASRATPGRLAKCCCAPLGEMCLHVIVRNRGTGIVQGLLHLGTEPGVVRKSGRPLTRRSQVVGGIKDWSDGVKCDGHAGSAPCCRQGGIG